LTSTLVYDTDTSTTCRTPGQVSVLADAKLAPGADPHQQRPAGRRLLLLRRTVEGGRGRLPVVAFAIP
jgi:hypothetical protein